MTTNNSIKVNPPIPPCWNALPSRCKRRVQQRVSPARLAAWCAPWLPTGLPVFEEVDFVAAPKQSETRCHSPFLREYLNQTVRPSLAVESQLSRVSSKFSAVIPV